MHPRIGNSQVLLYLFSIFFYYFKPTKVLAELKRKMSKQMTGLLSEFLKDMLIDGTKSEYFAKKRKHQFSEQSNVCLILY